MRPKERDDSTPWSEVVPSMFQGHCTGYRIQKVQLRGSEICNLIH